MVLYNGGLLLRLVDVYKKKENLCYVKDHVKVLLSSQYVHQ